jgi:hypothetical protein
MILVTWRVCVRSCPCSGGGISTNGLRERRLSNRLGFPLCGRYLVSQRTRPKKPARLRSWRVVIMRSKGEYLGSVEAPDRDKAEAVAIKLFDLDRDQRVRLLILERT